MPRTPTTHRPIHRDGGQALALVMITIALVAAVVIAAATVGGRMVQRSRAQVAADAAALAAVANGEVAAARVAGANGGRLVSISIQSDPAGTRAQVVVAVGLETARAAASSTP